MSIKIFGAILFFGALGIYLIYMINVYIPAVTEDVANADALMNAFIWALGCGSVATLGAIMAKKG